jgi:hypothetical protein
MEILDLQEMGFERGAHLLVKRALRQLPSGGKLQVEGSDPNLGVHLLAWCRAQGHALDGFVIARGDAAEGRWRGAERAGQAHPGRPGAVCDTPSPQWGLAARGAKVEANSLSFDFVLKDKDMVWTDEAARLYERAAAAQWDPNTAIDWKAPITHPKEVEDAVVQVMTYLIENETVALLVPARFLSQIHPHFREIMQLLAIQVADEARHIEVFTRRATLNREELGLSTAGGQASLKTLMDEPDFALATFLLSVLGEGSFLSLLWFLRDHAPDPVTREVATLTAQDEARHVAFGLAHLQRHVEVDPDLHGRLVSAINQRHESLAQTAGLNEEVFDALVLLAAGSWEKDDIVAGWDAVSQLKADMHKGRIQRLERLGFGTKEAHDLSSLHTRNFM